MILCIETASYVCSVALCERKQLIAYRESKADKSHASLLTVFIGELLEEHKLSASSLDAVAVSKGPGSYTGLRIGVSSAKGICYGAGIPLIAIGSLSSMFYGAKDRYSDLLEKDPATLICPMIDARRMEVYSSLFTLQGEEIEPVKAEVIDKSSYLEQLDKHKILFFGNGADKCKELIKHPNAIFAEGYELTASSLAIPSQEALENEVFEDVAYFEPYYLKDFVATIPRKNILGK